MLVQFQDYFCILFNAHVPILQLLRGLITLCKLQILAQLGKPHLSTLQLLLIWIYSSDSDETLISFPTHVPNAYPHWQYIPCMHMYCILPDTTITYPSCYYDVIMKVGMTAVIWDVTMTRHYTGTVTMPTDQDEPTHSHYTRVVRGIITLPCSI